MSTHKDDRPERAAEPAGGTRPWWRGRRTAIGVVALTALLGGGSYLLTTELTDRGTTRTSDTGALGARESAPSEAPASAAAPASATPSVAPSSSAATAKKSQPPMVSLAPSVATEIRKAREQAEKDGYPLLRPIAPAANAVIGPVNERSTADKSGSLRIITAEHDLSGQREMLWAADAGRPVGNTRCTDKFHFSNAQKPELLPTMLLCWRNTKAKSVVVVKVTYHGRPVARDTAAVVDREWAKL